MSSPVRSVSQAFGILRLLAERGDGQTLTEITRATALSPSSCLNLLRTLVAEGAIDVTGKRYQLAAGWQGCSAMLGGQQARLMARAQPLMTRFARQHDATVGLWRTDRGDRLELIALGESESPTRIHMVIGQRQPLGSGSTGRVLAASQSLDQPELRRRYDALRLRRPMSYAEYAQQVEEARVKGFAVDDGFAFAGVCSVACTIGTAPPFFCVSASTFAGMRDDASVAELGRALRELAAEIAAGVSV